MPRHLIVEADGGSRGNPGIAGYGSLVRDAETGEVLGECAAPLGKESNNVAEYTGLIEGLRMVAENASDATVLVHMDSKLVVEQMSGRWKIKHADMQRLAAEARELVDEIRAGGGAVRFEWIPREKNKAADKLSNDGMDGVTVRRDQWGGASGNTTDDRETSEELVAQKVLMTGSDEGSAASQVQSSSAATRKLARVVFIRAAAHGEPSLGADVDTPLSERGEQAARAVARTAASLAGDGATRIVSGTEGPAAATAAAVAHAIGTTTVTSSLWSEQDFGEWNRLSFKQVQQQPAFTELTSSQEFAPPRGESRESVNSRVAEALGTIRTEGGTWVIVTGRVPLMAVLADVLDLTVAASWQFSIAPGSVTAIEFLPDGGAQIAFVNHTPSLN